MSKKKQNKKTGKNKAGGKKETKRQYKLFFLKLMKITLSLDNDSALNKIPISQAYLIYEKRYHAFRTEKGEGGKLTKNDIRIIHNFILQHISNKQLEFIDDQIFDISLHEFLSTGLSLLHFLRELKADAFPLAHEVIEAFKEFSDYFRDGERIQEMMEDFSMYLSWLFSTVNQAFFKFSYGTVTNNDNTRYTRYVIDIIDPEIRHFEIKGASRPTYKLSYIRENGDLKSAKIKASEAGVSSVFQNAELDVYIQSHALKRMKERLDGFKINEENLYFFMSFSKPKIIQNSKGQYLIRYGDAENTLGYFTFLISEGCVLITSFLFLTNDNTPEGEKLRELFGLSKEGKTYFEIDKLSTFYSSDIADNKKAKQIFLKAGCGSLFNLSMHFPMKNEGRKQTADALLKYLQISDEE